MTRRNAQDANRLTISRSIPADVRSVFDAWTSAEKIKQWWGPANVRCVAANVDLRVGGRYLISNQLPDRSILDITGEYEVVDKPHRLVYTWQLNTAGSTTERVEVLFAANGNNTIITITHERIPTAELKTEHQAGWLGCLDGLVDYLR